MNLPLSILPSPSGPLAGLLGEHVVRVFTRDAEASGRFRP